MTYNVFGGTLNLALSLCPQYTGQSIKLTTPNSSPPPPSDNFLKTDFSLSLGVQLQLIPLN